MSDTPEVGELIARKYRITGLIGQGGMGAVYEAEHLELGKKVAIKFLRPELADDSQGAARFKREARAAAATGHPSIVDVYDVGTTGEGSLFFVMERLAGTSLREHLTAERTLPVSTACYVTAQVLSALEAAHRAGIVHRDIKPDNVFLVKTGQALPDVRLLDFGTSRMADPKKPEDQLTESGVALGTPFYMAPEQAMGEKELDHRVDVYASGVILYECLTAELPFRADNLYALVRRIIDAPVVPPSDLRQNLPDGLEAVVLKAMAREREERFASAGEMLEALLPFMEEAVAARVSLPEGVARQPEPPEPSEEVFSADTVEADSEGRSSDGAPRPVPRRPGLVLVVLLLLGLGVALGLRFFGARAEAPTAPGEDEPLASAGALLTAVEPAVVGADGGRSEDDVAPSNPNDGGGGEGVTVAIRLEGVPDGAVVLLGGEPADGHELELPRSAEPVTVEVRLEGHLPWSQRVAPERDTTLEVELQRRAGARPAAHAPPRPPVAPATSEGPSPPAGPDPAATDPHPTRPTKAPRPGDPGFDTEFRL